MSSALMSHIITPNIDIIGMLQDPNVRVSKVCGVGRAGDAVNHLPDLQANSKGVSCQLTR